MKKQKVSKKDATSQSTKSRNKPLFANSDDE